MKNSRILMITRAGVIAALYVVLTYVCMPIAYGPIQLRLGETLTILPLFYVESIPALFIGCIIANIGSPFGWYDIVFGSFSTLLAAVITFFIGKKIKNNHLKVFLGGLPSTLINSCVLPLVWFLIGADKMYWLNFASILLTQAIMIYVFGTPLFYAVDRLSKKGVRGFAICEKNDNLLNSKLGKNKILK